MASRNENLEILLLHAAAELCVIDSSGKHNSIRVFCIVD